MSSEQMRKTDSGTLLRQESRTVIHISVRLFANMHDIKTPSRESDFTATEMKHPGSVARMVSTLTDLRSLLVKTQSLKLAAVVEEKKQARYIKNTFCWKEG